MILHTLIVSILLVGTSLAEPDPADSVTNINKLVDQIISALKAYQTLDPLHVPDHKMLLRKRVGSQPHQYGHAAIANTQIVGLSDVHRIEDVKLADNIQINDTFSVKLHMGKGNVKVLSDSKVVIGQTTHPNLKVSADIVDISMQFTIAPGQLPAISQFSINEFKYAKFQVDGLTDPKDPLINALSEVYMVILNHKARPMLVSSIRPILEEELKNFKLA